MDPRLADNTLKNLILLTLGPTLPGLNGQTFPARRGLGTYAYVQLIRNRFGFVRF